MLDTVFGTKIDVTRKFDQKGKRLPVTRIKTGPCLVAQIKTEDKDGYSAIQLGWGEKDFRKVKKAQKGHLKGAKLKKAPLYFSEVKLDKLNGLKVGDKIEPGEVIKPGDLVKVTGWSKGRGFTGVVKRWGFAGGPRTHGQSDRQRAPGSIGQGTTPGRVFKGKKMAGRSGGNRVTLSGLTVMGFDPDDNVLLVKGLVPGPRKGRLIIRKTGKDKQFVPFLSVGEEVGKREEESKGEKEVKKKKIEKEEIQAKGQVEATEVGEKKMSEKQKDTGVLK